MRKSRFTDEQMVGIIREADRDGVAAVAKRHKVSGQTLYPGFPRSRLLSAEYATVRRMRQASEGPPRA